MGEEMMKSMEGIGIQGMADMTQGMQGMEGMKEIGKAMADMGMDEMAKLYQLLLQIQKRNYNCNVRDSRYDK